MITLLLILWLVIITTLLVTVMIALNAPPLLTVRLVVITIITVITVIVPLISVSIQRCLHIVGTV